MLVFLVEWENRFLLAPRDANIFVSIDGTDFRIQEQSLFYPKWYSHKFHGPGLRYELGICIRTGYIVLACGVLPCGEWSDLRLARHACVLGIREGEKAIADQGYRDHNYFEIPNGDNDAKKKEKNARYEFKPPIETFSLLE